MRRRLLALALLLTAFNAVCERLEIRVWTALDPFVGGEEGPLTEEDVRRRLLEEARLVISGMLYGYRFRYTPSDRARGVAEEFALDPIAEIQWGDPALEADWIEERENKIWAGVSYELADYQEARIRSWGSNVMPASTGRGERSVFIGREAKAESREEAIKQAIREYARSEIPNKPRELAGDVVIWEAPYTVVGSGQYITTVRIKLLLNVKQPYRFY